MKNAEQDMYLGGNGHMFVKKLCAAAVAAVMSVSAVYVASAAEYAPYIRYITEEGGAEILDGTGYESHIYEPSTGTLAFTEDTTLFGNDYNIDGYCGSAIIPSEHNTDLTIELAGHNITMLSTEHTAGWIAGIYRNGGTLTVKGPGTLTVTSSGGTSENAALMGYSGADIVITDDAQVTLSNGDENGKGLWASGDVRVEGGAVLEMSGGSSAVELRNNGRLETDGNIVKAGGSKAEAEDWNGSDDIASFKYVKVESPKSTESLGVWVGGKAFSEAVPSHTFGNVTASYDGDTETLVLGGSGTITGSFDVNNSYGAAIYAEHDINIVVNGDVNLTGARNENGIYSYGIYTDYKKHGRITISGCGVLRVSADSTVSGECAAIAAYIGEGRDYDRAVVIKGGVTVYADAGGEKQFGVFASAEPKGSGYGRIYVSENARLYASGGRSALYALDTNGLVWGTKKITVKDKNNNAAEFDSAKLNEYKAFASEPFHSGSSAIVRLNVDNWAGNSSLTAAAESGGSYTINEELGCELDGKNIGFSINGNLSFPNEYDRKFKNAAEGSSFEAEICYYDKGMGGFYFQYDSHDGVKNIFIQCENTNTWKYARIKLYDAELNGGANGFDCRIITADEELFPYAEDNKSPEPVYVFWFGLYSSESCSPFKISANSVKPGNVFYEGERVKFNVLFENTDGAQYENMTVSYNIYKPESNDMYAQWEETENTAYKGDPAAYSQASPVASKTQTAVFSGKNAADTVTFEGLPFGTYVLKADITADGTDNGKSVSMSYITDLAYSKKAEPNIKIGANAHYDDYESENGELTYLYDESDIDDQIALARDAGFGIMRSSVRWWNVKGWASAPYSMPDIIKYAYAELAENGMSGLCNLMQDNSLNYGSRWDGNDVLGDTQEEIDEFERYASFVAKELAPYTKYFSILNEFDRCANGAAGLSGDSYDAPTAEIYAELVKTASEAIRNEISDAWINAGCISQDPAWQFEGYKGKYTWDTRFLRALDTSAVNSISFQRYSHRAYGPEGTDLTGMPKYGSMLVNEYAPNAEMWITETGFSARDRDLYLAGAESAFKTTTYQKQAEYLPRMLAMYAGGDKVDTLIFYELQDDREDPFAYEANYGLIHSKFYRTPWAAKPSYVSVAAFNSIVGHAVKSESLGVVVEHTTNSQTHLSWCPIVYRLTNDKGQEIYCVWSTRDTGSYMVNTGKKYAVVYDMYGNVIETASGGTVTVSAEQDIKYVVGYDELPQAPELTDPEGPERKTEFYAEHDGERLTDISGLKDGDELVIRYTDAGENDDCTIICAAYSGDMLAHVLAVNSDACQNGEKSVRVNVGDVSAFDEIKLFAWGKNQTPKTECISLAK